MTKAEKRGRQLVYGRSGGVCEKCGCARATEWHHRKNRSQSGEWCPTNGMHVCSLCHLWITNHPKLSRDHGWALRSTDDPVTSFVFIRGRFSYLTTDGRVTDSPEVSDVA